MEELHASREQSTSRICLISRCPYQKLDPAVMMMKSAEKRLRADLTEPLNRARERCIFGEGEMRPDVIVMGGIGSKHSAQYGLHRTTI
jgi:hypothetical protein